MKVGPGKSSSPLKITEPKQATKTDNLILAPTLYTNHLAAILPQSVQPTLQKS